MRITLNGREVEVREGATILEAAREHGFEIPTLCHDEQLEPFTSCWICAVRLEGMRRYVPACGTRVAPGMKIWTDTEDVRAVRKMALELLLSNHRGDCIAPCKARCPAGVDVQGYVALIAQRKYREATKLVKEVNPFPLSIGRVCPRPCETECRRNAVDGPVAIDYLKRFAADWDLTHGEPWSPDVAPPTGKRVALVGAGPGSLTTAYYLAQRGHETVVFEALPKAGGMLRYGIPEYRLPKAVLDDEIGLITKLGVSIEYGKALGRDFTIGDLLDRGFDAVFLGLGAMGSRRMGVPGEDLAGVWAGTEFLKKIGLGQTVEVGRRVAIVGGGNTAIDAARTCVRLGAEKVTIVYRRSRREMPAWDVEVEAALAEGVEMHFLAAPTKIEGDGRCRRMEYIRMELGEPDESGRRRPVPIEGSEQTIEVDNVIAAIGQMPDLACIDRTAERDPDSVEAKIELTRWGTIVADDGTGATAVPGVFAGGDVVRGAATAIEAIADGGAAAAAIDRYLRGAGVAAPPPLINVRKERWDELPPEEFSDVERRPRQEMPELPVEERVHTFDEVELGFTEEQALEEAKRCLECGCVGAFTCKLRQYATEYGAVVERFEGEVVRAEADERHPFIRIEPEKCILCARCIRICEEIQGAAALGFFRRGFDAQMKPALDRPLAATECESCGQCVQSCPTAALSVRPELPKPGPWALSSVTSTCPFCGVGCTVSLNTIAGALATVSGSRTAGGLSEGNLCVRGRFGLSTVLADGRLATPLVRAGGGFSEASWDEAVGRARERLARAVAERGPGAVAVFGGPRLTNEEAYCLQKLARGALGTPNVGSFGLGLESRAFGALAALEGRPSSTASYDDLRAAETILLLDSDIAEEQTVAGIAIRKAVRAGARLIVLSPVPTRMARLATQWIRVDRDGMGDVLAAMVDRLRVAGGGAASKDGVFEELLASVPVGFRERLGGLADGVAEAADAFASAKRGVLVANAMSFDAAFLERDAGLAVAVAAAAGKATAAGSGVLFLRMRANGQGITEAGLAPELLPGGLHAADSETRSRLERLWGVAPPEAVYGSVDELFAAMETGAIAVALIVGEDPVGGSDDPARVARVLWGLDVLVVADTVETETTKLADVVLPLAAPSETAGTFTNSAGQRRAVAPISSAPWGRTNLELLAALGSGLGVDLGSGDPDTILRELDRVLADAGSASRHHRRSGGQRPPDVRPSGGSAMGGTRGPADSPPLRFDPRWTDVIEARFARRVEELGLPAHVVRRYGV